MNFAGGRGIFSLLFIIEYGTIHFTNLGVAQLVACYLGVVEVVGSSPVTQTKSYM